MPDGAGREGAGGGLLRDAEKTADLLPVEVVLTRIQDEARTDVGQQVAQRLHPEDEVVMRRFRPTEQPDEHREFGLGELGQNVKLAPL
ncbi:hypothetical protein ACLQ17_26040 [Streptomyces sp. DT197]|uniref:hypothetical protein n=1 Tax=Streptomyces sp. DT197 TaxID=3393417 RepID=UPI003CEFA7BD